MISPQKWMLKRPGILLPVFFLSLLQVSVAGQDLVREPAVAALGGCYVARTGFMAASQNQAGLAWNETHSLSLQHSRPFMALGLSVLAVQIKGQRGGWGAVGSTFGIAGLRWSSLWLSYGKNLSPVISAGLGMHIQTFSLPEKSFYHPGLDLALGLQARFSELWILGAHVETKNSRQNMLLSAGCSYSIFGTATLYADLHLMPGRRIRLSGGLEWDLRHTFSILLGFTNQPVTWSAGLVFPHKKLVMQLAFQYVPEQGSIPHSSLHYVW